MMNRKNELYTNLVETLDQSVKVYRNLLDLIRKEKDILIGADMAELDESNRAKEAMLVKLKLLEQARMKVARDLAREVDCNVDNPRLLEIASHFEGEPGDRLRNLHSVLDLMLKRVSDLNKENEILVQSALKTANGAMDQIRDSFQEKTTYQRKGALSPNAVTSSGQLVRKEV